MDGQTDRLMNRKTVQVHGKLTKGWNVSCLHRWSFRHCRLPTCQDWKQRKEWSISTRTWQVWVDTNPPSIPCSNQLQDTVSLVRIFILAFDKVTWTHGVEQTSCSGWEVINQKRGWRIMAPPFQQPEFVQNKSCWPLLIWNMSVLCTTIHNSLRWYLGLRLA